MRNVIPNLLWIGNVLDVADLTPIFEEEIEAIVDLALNEKPAQLAREWIYCRFPLNDGSGNPPQRLRAAVDGVQSLISKRIPTLVYCSAGMSRSLAVTAMALARIRGHKAEDTLVALATGQPHDVSPVLWRDICTACAADLPAKS
jgi:protein-tyrosine phosphatase